MGIIHTVTGAIAFAIFGGAVWGIVEEEGPPPDAELSPELIKRGAQKVCELNRAGLMVFEAASLFYDHIRERYPAAVIESGFELED